MKLNNTQPNTTFMNPTQPYTNETAYWKPEAVEPANVNPNYGGWGPINPVFHKPEVK